MMLAPFAAAFLALCLTVSVADSGWVLWGQSLYRVNPDQTGELNYHSATRLCENYGAHLVVPASKAENDFIWDLYQELSPINGMWIGCSRSYPFEWGCAEDGGAGIDTQYRNWSPSTQESTRQPGKVCPVISATGWADSSGQWGVLNCQDIKWVICEKPLRQPAALPNLCNTLAGNGQNCLATKLLSVMQYKHLVIVAMHAGGSRYSITADSDPCNQTAGYSVLSSDLKVDAMKVESWNITVHYSTEKK